MTRLWQNSCSLVYRLDQLKGSHLLSSNFLGFCMTERKTSLSDFGHSIPEFIIFRPFSLVLRRKARLADIFSVPSVPRLLFRWWLRVHFSYPSRIFRRRADKEERFSGISDLRRKSLSLRPRNALHPVCRESIICRLPRWRALLRVLTRTERI